MDTLPNIGRTFAATALPPAQKSVACPHGVGRFVGWRLGRWVGPHLSVGGKRPLQVEGVTSTFSVTAVTGMSPEGNIRGSSTEWRSRLWLLGVFCSHRLRRDQVLNLADCRPSSLSSRRGGLASISILSSPPAYGVKRGVAHLESEF